MTTKLSKAQDIAIESLAKFGKQSAFSKTIGTITTRRVLIGLDLVRFEKRSQFDSDGQGGFYELTDAGREYAQSRGWIASEAATVEAQSGETPELCILASNVKVGDVFPEVSNAKVVEITQGEQLGNPDLVFIMDNGWKVHRFPYQTIRVIEAQQPAHEPTRAGDFDLLSMGNVSEGEEIIKTSDIQEGDLLFYGDWREVAYVEHMQNGWTRIMDTHGDSFTSETKSGIRRLVAVLSVSIPVRSTPQTIPAAQFTDSEQLATYARERIKQAEATGAIPTASTPLSVLHEAIKALNGVNDPTLRTRDCVERTERALGLLIDELLPLLERKQTEIAQLKALQEKLDSTKTDMGQFIGVFNALSKWSRSIPDTDERFETWKYQIHLTNQEYDRLTNLTVAYSSLADDLALESDGA